ncbi:hypothetical protein DSO57_1014965 [Entomophthora muscae]|uniref:Uncharacterized protein n=1 Tax=Entomophthora muscae TaxID=34485 RepID=A0ACC2UES3_9FUNG|nr:hypothetical protein DSO57_1014965 [Entomophthora muscae]
MRDYVVKNMYTSSNGVTHVYLRQKVDGKEVFNANININLAHDGTILSYGDSFYRPVVDRRGRSAAARFPTRLPSAAVTMSSFLGHVGIQTETPIIEKVSDFASGTLTLDNVPGAKKEAKAMLGWIQVETGDLEPVWDLQVELKEDYYHAHVSPFSQQPLAVHNWVHRAVYHVMRFRMNDPDEGSRSIVINPENPEGSPLGWHDTGKGNSNDTSGNNVIATKVTAFDPRETDSSSRVYGGPDLNFDFEFNDKKDPETYKDAAVTNLFYWNNMIHDLYYHYGFDEKAGNFQQNNFGKGGEEGDAVIAHAQDPLTTNNAYFSTPPDGEHGHMQMFVFDVTNPHRDGDFDSGIMIHEYTHGLSTRLTGGPANSDCLNDGEAGGMGEGWGDAVSLMIRTRTTYDRHTDLGIGGYVLGVPTIRKYMYSTNMTTNPDKFSYLGRDSYQEVHNAGQVWAVMLYEVYWNLIDKLGFYSDWLGRSGFPITKYGNTLALQLVIDGMKLQPCDPSFIDARDAIIQAESILTKGEHACEIWKGFAKRGLGIHASVNYSLGEDSHKDSFEIPPQCVPE